MIVSHRHRFIFVKTRKTAGTSIELALAAHCGSEDVITRLADADEALRRALGRPGPQNELLPRTAWQSADRLRALVGRRAPRYRNHLPAARIRRAVGEHVWHGYFKFCVERDPWDKAVSLYYWRTRDASPRPTPAAFFAAVKPRALSNHHLYTIDGELVMDRVIRYERLAEELEDVRQLLGLPAPLELPSAKSGHRPERVRAEAVLGPDEYALVARVCAKEIALFDYGGVG